MALLKFQYAVVTILLSGMLFSSVSHAEPICETIEECRQVQWDVEMQLRNLEPPLDRFVNDGRGEIKELSLFRAEQFCEERGTELPSIRRIALALNPKGVFFVKPSDYDPLIISTIYKNDGTVDFYYDPRTYVRDRYAEAGLKPRDSYRFKLVSSSFQNRPGTFFDYSSNRIYYFDIVSGNIYWQHLHEYDALGLRYTAYFAFRCAAR